MCHETFLGFDPDDLFAYSTPRLVKIKDRRLGLLYYGLMLIIVIYVVGFNIVYEMGYRAAGAVVGTARLQLQQALPPFRRDPSRLMYCGNGTFETPRDREVMPQAQCRFYDANDAVYPPVESQALFVSTRITATTQDLTSSDPTVKCTDDMLDESCDWEAIESALFYIGDVEFSTLKIDHAMAVPSFGLSRSAVQMHGTPLMASTGAAVDPCDVYKTTFPNESCPTSDSGGYISYGETGHSDILALATLLEMAGITSLDDIQGTFEPFSNETHRNAGLILVLSIEYDNYWSFNEEAIRYTYEVTNVTNTEFKGVEVLPNAGGEVHDQRQLLDRHGIRIVVKQSGTIGEYRTDVLLIQLVASLALVTAAAAGVNFIAFSIMPLKYIYNQYRTVDTVDFSDVGHMDQETLDRFKTEDLINPKPAIFAKSRRAQEEEEEDPLYSAAINAQPLVAGEVPWYERPEED